MNAKAGSWVEIQIELLAAGERSERVPSDTAAVPLIMRVRGFSVEDGSEGGVAKVETLVGRQLEGRLSNAKPRHTHDFGRPDPDVLFIGREVRALLMDANVR